MRQMPAVFADLPLEEGQKRPQDVVAESGRGIIDVDGGWWGRRAVIDGEVRQQDYYLYERGPHLVAGTAEQVFTKSAHVVEEHVVSKPRPDGGGRAEV